MTYKHSLQILAFGYAFCIIANFFLERVDAMLLEMMLIILLVGLGIIDAIEKKQG